MPHTNCELGQTFFNTEVTIDGICQQDIKIFGEARKFLVRAKDISVYFRTADMAQVATRIKLDPNSIKKWERDLEPERNEEGKKDPTSLLATIYWNADVVYHPKTVNWAITSTLIAADRTLENEFHLGFKHPNFVSLDDDGMMKLKEYHAILVIPGDDNYHPLQFEDVEPEAATRCDIDEI